MGKNNVYVLILFYFCDISSNRIYKFKKNITHKDKQGKDILTSNFFY